MSVEDGNDCQGNQEEYCHAYHIHQFGVVLGSIGEAEDFVLIVSQGHPDGTEVVKPRRADGSTENPHQYDCDL